MDYNKHLQLSFKAVELYEHIEDELLRMVAKRLKRTGAAFAFEEQEGGKTVVYQAWQVKMMNELGSLNNEAIQRIAQYSGLAEREVMSMLYTAGYGQLDMSEKIMNEAFDKGLLDLKPPVPDDDQQLLRILQTYENQALSELNMVNSKLLQGVNQVYADIVNTSVAEVITGIKTPQQAIADTIKKWSHKGVPVFQDKAGRQWATDTYLNMVLRSMNNNIANGMQAARREAYGVNYIEVSSKSVARPLCAPYQGRIFYTGSGTDPLKKYPHFSSTSHGEPAGLFGINCGHFEYPYIPGLNTPTYEPYEASEVAEKYELTQKQRYYERRVRQFKREEMMFKEAQYEDQRKEASQKKLAEQKRLRAFTEKHSLSRRLDRERVY